MVVVRSTVLGCVLAGTASAPAMPGFPVLPEALRGKLHALSEATEKPQQLASANGLPAKPSPPAKPRLSTSEWIDQNVTKRIEVRGSRQLGVHMHTVTGDREAFNLLNYYGQGDRRFTDTGQMSLTGTKVLGVLDFQMQLSDNRFRDPEAQRMTVNYDRGPLKMSFGDIRGTLLNTNRFASFSRYLEGAMAELDYGDLKLKVIHSAAKGSARTVSIEGSNSSGPYYLQSGRVLPDSVEVQVDGQPVKLMEDYVLDADFGSITFVNRVISPTSTIVVTYEAYGFGAPKGTLQGGGLTYDMGKFGRLGVTHLEQVGTGLGTGGSIVQKDSGSGQADFTYLLEQQPIPGSLKVKVSGVDQFEGPPDAPGGDYYFVPGLPFAIRFKRIIPYGAPVDFIYRPVPTKNVDGDRRVFGIDYRLPLGSKGFVQFSQATGQLMNEATPMSGTARGIDGRYSWGDLTLHGSVRDVPNTFVSVESRGFNRNERATDWGLDYNRGRMKYGFRTNNSAVAVRQTNGTDLSFVTSRATTAHGFATYADPGGTSWNLSHTRTAGRTNFDTRLDSTSLTGTKRIGSVDASLELKYQSGFGPISDGVTTQQGDIALRTAGLGLRFNPAKALSVDARASLSEIRALDKTGNGSDIAVSAHYRPEKSPFSIITRYTQSDSGAVASLGGFFSGAGYGYNGNGFTGGVVGSGLLGAGNSNLRQFEFIPTYRIGDKMTINAHYFKTKTEGTFSSNADTTTVGLGFDWSLGNFTTLAAALNQTDTRFFSLGQGSTLVGGQAKTTSLSAFLSGAPSGPWSYTLGVWSMISGGSGAFQQDSLSVDALLNYRVNSRQRASLRLLNGNTTGIYGQRDSFAAAYYSYSIWRGVSLVGSYKLRDVRNLNSALNSGAYRSSGFDLELMFDFMP